MYAFTEYKTRSHGADHSRGARQSESLPNAIHSFNPSTVRADQVRDFKIFHLVRSPIQLIVGRRKAGLIKLGDFLANSGAPATGCRLSGAIEYQNGSHRHRDPDL